MTVDTQSFLKLVRISEEAAIDFMIAEAKLGTSEIRGRSEL